MYKVLHNNTEQTFETLDQAMTYAKQISVFVTIQGNGFEACGMFGVDSIENGKCPDGIAYDWNKANRIGRVKKERV